VSLHDDPYSEIGSMLARAAGAAEAPWMKVVLKAQVGEGWGKFEASAFEGHGTWRSVRVNAPRLLQLLARLREVTRSVAQPGQPDWTTIRFTMKQDGDFNTHFGYEPLPPE
jgi:hypothetical protein